MCVSLCTPTTSILFIRYFILSWEYSVSFIAISMGFFNFIVLHTLSYSKSFNILPIKIDYMFSFDLIHRCRVEAVSDIFLSLAIRIALSINLRLGLVDFQTMNFHMMSWMPYDRLLWLLFLFWFDNREGQHLENQ